MKTINTIFTKGCMVLASAALLTTGCTDDFLKQDPLSFYNPENTYTTESGLKAAMAMCDYGLKEMLMDGNSNVLPMASLYFMTDMLKQMQILYRQTSLISLLLLPVWQVGVT